MGFKSYSKSKSFEPDRLASNGKERYLKSLNWWKRLRRLLTMFPAVRRQWADLSLKPTLAGERFPSGQSRSICHKDDMFARGGIPCFGSAVSAN